MIALFWKANPSNTESVYRNPETCLFSRQGPRFESARGYGDFFLQKRQEEARGTLFPAEKTGKEGVRRRGPA